MDYIKLRPDLDSDPDFMEAGWWATRVYELLLKVSAAKDLRGRIPPEYQRLGWLARFFNLSPDVTPGTKPEELIRHGLDRLFEFRKVVLEEDTWVIRGWENFYRPAVPGVERTKNWRDRKKQDEGDQKAPGVTNGDDRASRVTTGDARDATHPPTTPTHAPTPHTGVRSAVAAPVGDLRDGIEAEFKKLRGTAYRWSSQDEFELRQALDLGVPEILRRWSIALRREGYPRCDSVRDLVKHLNAYAADQPRKSNPGDPRRAPIRAEDQNHGEVDLDAKI